MEFWECDCVLGFDTCVGVQINMLGSRWGRVGVALRADKIHWRVKEPLASEGATLETMGATLTLQINWMDFVHRSGEFR
jgi:hypothetical protein